LWSGSYLCHNKSMDNKPNFIENEKKILKWWYESGLVERYLQKNRNSQKKFFFLDGPITANNPMGVHHAWGRTYKDLWQRFFNMRGYKQRFQNGFDCQGLWVEVEVEKELGLKNKKDIENLVSKDQKASIDKFVQLCKERVRKYSSIQTEQSKMLGYFMDWENSYYTNSDDNNYMIWYFLKKCHEKNLLYKGHDSVPWCYRCGIAISQHEILTEDYQEVTHETVFFKLPLVGKKDTYLLVWTTTPWTIPANVSVAVNTKEKYVKVQFQNELLILMEKRYQVLKNDLGLGEIVAKLSASDLMGLEYEGPFDDLPLAKKAKKANPRGFHFVVSGLLRGDELVTSDEGTGLLHVAPGAGEEDFQLGKELDLCVIGLINEEANYIDGLGEFSGQNAKIHPEIIIKNLELKENGRYILTTKSISHRYPVCWRCKTELVWRVVDEWYIRMSEELRENMRKVVKKIKWIPGFGLERELDWISNMHDWLISKKRYYGLCLPIYECNKCNSFEILGSKEELEERAVEGWDEFKSHSPHRPWLDLVKIKCSKCSAKLSRIQDVGNVWLDAGIVTFSTLLDPDTQKVSYMNDKKYFKKWYPADFITESFPGQFKNWFYSLLVMGTVLEDHEPFNTVLGFATLLGEDGKPMHKSNKKTFVSFDDGADKIGVDVLRWLYVTSDPTRNLLFGFNIADAVRRRFHLLVWNILSFYLSYALLNKDSKKSVNKSSKSKNILDVWITIRLNDTINTVTRSLEKFDSFAASIKIENFVSDLSLWYVRRSRDRVSFNNEDLLDKTACLDTMHNILLTLSKLLAPFIPFMSEKMYQTLLNFKQNGAIDLEVENFSLENSVHLADWPETNVLKSNDKDLLRDMETVREIVEMAHAKRKEANIKVRQPLSQLLISNPSSGQKGLQFPINQELLSLIKDELNVKNVKISRGDDELSVDLDTVISQELQEEGEARDLVRKIQEERKKLNCGLSEYVVISLPSWPKRFLEYLKKETLAKKIVQGEFLVRRDKMEE